MISDWIYKFEEDHWDKVPQEPSKLNSYHKDYRLKFNHLPVDKPLSLGLLKQVILERTQPGTCSRKGYAMTYRRLAEFAGLPDTRDLGALERGYSSKSVLKELTQGQGYMVRGLAPNAEATHGLGESLDIKTTTVAEPLVSQPLDEPPQSTLWIVDEAGLLITSQIQWALQG